MPFTSLFCTFMTVDLGAVPLEVSIKHLELIKWRTQRFRLVNRVSSKWETFGRRLDLYEDQLVCWERECLGKPARCWIEVMKYWLREGGIPPDYHPATWEKLYVLLDDVEYTEVTNELKEIIKASRAPAQ